MIETLALAGAAAAGLITTLVLFLQVKREISARERREQHRAEAAADATAARLAALERRCQDLWQIAQTHVPPMPPPSGIDITKRTQAIQMHRRGEAPETIAAALALPRNEVDLLLKVHGMTVEPR